MSDSAQVPVMCSPVVPVMCSPVVPVMCCAVLCCALVPVPLSLSVLYSLVSLALCPFTPSRKSERKSEQKREKKTKKKK